MFPLIAKDGGTLIRSGHTEAVIDIAKLAKSNLSGVICETMKDDGEMARSVSYTHLTLPTNREV